MTLTWRTKKQVFYFLLLVLFFASIFSLFFLIKFSGGTCIDRKKNQGESGVDCGGPCAPCPVNLKEPIVLWSRFFKSSPDNDTYDAAALMENLNQEWESKNIFYTFKFYDQNNILIVEKKGNSFLNSKEKALIFENGIYVGERSPAKSVLIIEPVLNWKYTKKLPPNFIVTKKDFSLESSLLEIEIKNDANSDFDNAYLNVVFTDQNDNAYAASATKIDHIASESTAKASFTWSYKLEMQPAKIEIFSRVNLTK